MAEMEEESPVWVKSGSHTERSRTSAPPLSADLHAVSWHVRNVPHPDQIGHDTHCYALITDDTDRGVVIGSACLWTSFHVPLS
jgi:hypothetical protein